MILTLTQNTMHCFHNNVLHVKIKSVQFVLVKCTFSHGWYSISFKRLQRFNTITELKESPLILNNGKKEKNLNQRVENFFLSISTVSRAFSLAALTPDNLLYGREMYSTILPHFKYWLINFGCASTFFTSNSCLKRIFTHCF